MNVSKHIKPNNSVFGHIKNNGENVVHNFISGHIHDIFSSAFFYGRNVQERSKDIVSNGVVFGNGDSHNITGKVRRQ